MNRTTSLISLLFLVCGIFLMYKSLDSAENDMIEFDFEAIAAADAVWDAQVTTAYTAPFEGKVEIQQGIDMRYEEKTPLLESLVSSFLFTLGGEENDLEGVQGLITLENDIHTHALTWSQRGGKYFIELVLQTSENTQTQELKRYARDDVTHEDTLVMAIDKSGEILLVYNDTQINTGILSKSHRRDVYAMLYHVGAGFAFEVRE